MSGLTKETNLRIVQVSGDSAGKYQMRVQFEESYEALKPGNENELGRPGVTSKVYA